MNWSVNARMCLPGHTRIQARIQFRLQVSISLVRLVADPTAAIAALLSVEVLNGLCTVMVNEHVATIAQAHLSKLELRHHVLTKLMQR